MAHAPKDRDRPLPLRLLSFAALLSAFLVAACDGEPEVARDDTPASIEEFRENAEDSEIIEETPAQEAAGIERPDPGVR